MSCNARDLHAVSRPAVLPVIPSASYRPQLIQRLLGHCRLDPSWLVLVLLLNGSGYVGSLAVVASHPAAESRAAVRPRLIYRCARRDQATGIVVVRKVQSLEQAPCPRELMRRVSQLTLLGHLEQIPLRDYLLLTPTHVYSAGTGWRVPIPL